jgi:hypothetical protein
VRWVRTDRSQPRSAEMPTRAARSSGFRSLPFPGAVRWRRVNRIWEAMGMAGWVAEGKRGMSSEVDMSRGGRYWVWSHACSNESRMLQNSASGRNPSGRPEIWDCL